MQAWVWLPPGPLAGGRRRCVDHPRGGSPGSLPQLPVRSSPGDPERRGHRRRVRSPACPRPAPPRPAREAAAAGARRAVVRERDRGAPPAPWARGCASAGGRLEGAPSAAEVVIERSAGPDAAEPLIGVVGAGVTGATAGRVLGARGARVAWYDTRVGAAVRAAGRWGGAPVDDAAALEVCDAVVLASPPGHAPFAEDLVAAGCPVVSTSDAVDDVHALLHLHAPAVARGVSLVVGAAMCPGLSGLLVAGLVERLARVDEIHVAMHGTGGPACARQHHDALGDPSSAWHDGEWISRPGGSGRELCWFPEPIGAVDCYRAALPDPILLHRAFPGLLRISARLSATRRDRLTARLPMLAPPRRHGDVGGIRVEVRGADDDGGRLTHVAGAGGRSGTIAGTVAALYAEAVVQGRTPPGSVVRRRGRMCSPPTCSPTSVRSAWRCTSSPASPAPRHGEAAAHRASCPPRRPWMPPGRTVAVPGRGDVFLRWHRHDDPTRPTVAAAARVDVDRRPPVLHRVRGPRGALLVHRRRSLRPRSRGADPGSVRAGARRGRRRPRAARAGRRAGDRARVLDGWTDRAPAAATAPGTGRRHRRAGDGAVMERELVRTCPLAHAEADGTGAALVGVPAHARPDDPLGARRRLAAAARTSRGSSRRCAATTRTRSSRPGVRSAASTLGRGRRTSACPAASLVTSADRLVPPGKQRALAAALRAHVVEVPLDHLAPWEDPEAYNAATMALDRPRQRSLSAPRSGSSAPFARAARAPRGVRPSARSPP